ncbi:lytic transglycosylase [Thiocapsa imhoffii]|uniref:Lytic transglycosylase n=1 Tax=Thiocapsa imhoffii TaxID=382777 RepID=A0A9X0WK98_9GAMM|nr:LysM peptidoglycan-binding domain-containing protein [Thiocapsa imhoffii]MBK1646259.1 lytic transglycosylase [Thiocapsa imhoffii]
MADVIRYARGGCAIGVLVLLTSGCATDKRATAVTAVDDAHYGGVVSAREYGFVRPAVDVVVTERGRGQVAPARADARGDLWQRVRAGLALDLAASPRIDDTAERFSRDAQYLARMSHQATPYLHAIVEEIERRGLPMELAFLPHVESRFNPRATSPKAAAGIWQFMPGTGREMGLRQDAWHDERRDALASTGAALDYLQQLHRRFDGDWELAMAAYNCGPGRVASAQAENLRRGRPTDFWSLDNLPSETKHYVPQILATARLVAEPNRYGLTLPPVPDRPQIEVVRTQRSLDLERIATASGVPLYELQRLNPGLKLGRTAPDRPGHIIVPIGIGERLGQSLEQVQVLPATASVARATTVNTTPRPRATQVQTVTRFHVVKGGENLSSIAREHGIETDQLARLNGLSQGESVLPGQTLRIQLTQAGPIRHRVARGESVKSLARRYGVTIQDLQRWNQIADNRLKPGDIILIYAPREAPLS